ncbi:TPA: hypothetical protein OGT20_000366 [Escherichia coli]|nr:hypothetical protein [Escherichia coli]
MRSWFCLIALLLPGIVFASGEVIIQPQSKGEVHFLARGLSSGGDNIISAAYSAGRPLSVLFSPTGNGHCEGDFLAVDHLRLSVQQAGENTSYTCGVPVTIESPSKDGILRLQLTNSTSVQDFSSLMRTDGGLRQQIGNLQITQQGNESFIVPIYLDLTILQNQVVTIAASFEKPTLQLGLVGPEHDASETVGLRVSKTLQAGEEAMLYRVTFESSQLKDNRFHLLSSVDHQFIPYQIYISGVEVTPSQPYVSELPQGKATSELLDVRFNLSGRAVRGMAAGSRLLDTVTAVVTPES